MNYTQFYGNTFLFINKNANEFPLPKESKEVDLNIYYEEIEKPSNDTRKQYMCDFINKDGSEASLCGNALLRLMEQEGVGHYVFHTISGLYEGWNNENEMGLLMKKAKISLHTTTVNRELHYDENNIETEISKTTYTNYRVNIGNEHIVYMQPLERGQKQENSNQHFLIQKDKNTFEVRCFEQGVGETQACGSGAYAVGIAMIKHFKLSEVNIIMKGGKYLVKEGFLIVKKI